MDWNKTAKTQNNYSDIYDSNKHDKDASGVFIGINKTSELAGWSSGRDAKELKASMETIRKTAGTLIDAIGEQLNVLQREREMELLDSDVVLKLSEQDRTAYFIVRNMAAEEIRQQIEIYHGMDSAFKGEMEEFLRGLGADVIPLWDSVKENRAVCPTFYTLEYDTAQGITAL